VASLGITAHLHARGWEVRLVALVPDKARCPGPPFESPFTSEPLLLKQPRTLARASTGQQFGLFSLVWWRRLIDYLGDWHPTCVHVHFSTGHHALLGWLASLRFGAPLILTWHSWPHIATRGGEITRQLCLAADAVTAVSGPFAQAIGAQLNLPPECVQGIPNAVDPPSVPFVPPSSSQRVLGIGNFLSLKRWPDLLRAFAAVKREMPEATLTIAGDGPERSLCRSLSEESGLADSVSLPGVVSPEQIDSLIMGSRVVVLISEAEGLPVALLEGAACGRPLIGSHTGGITDIIDDGVNGFLVPVGDPGAVAQRLTQLLSDNTLADRLGQESRRLCQERFTWEAVVPQYEAVLQRVLASHQDNQGSALTGAQDVASFGSCLALLKQRYPQEPTLQQAAADIKAAASVREAWERWREGKCEQAREPLRRAAGEIDPQNPFWPWAAAELTHADDASARQISTFWKACVQVHCQDDNARKEMLAELLSAASYVEMVDGRRMPALRLAAEALCLRPSAAHLAAFVERLLHQKGHPCLPPRK
jgi:glycosyltransferase involved in cell wall biosynthesis